MILWLVIGIAALHAIAIVVRPSLAAGRRGHPFAFVALLVLPVIAIASGLSAQVDKSKTTAFCTSCHIMRQYGHSLHIDDVSHVPATHFINGRVPRDKACYECHTQYTMYGDLHSKLRGLKHVWVQYLGKIPDRIELYSPYNNRECLHCHEGARPFEEAKTHQSEPTTLARIRTNELSCMSKGCHDAVHDVANLKKLTFWGER